VKFQRDFFEPGVEKLPQAAFILKDVADDDRRAWNAVALMTTIKRYGAHRPGASSGLVAVPNRPVNRNETATEDRRTRAIEDHPELM
jgi:hypothetical protein